MKNRKLHIQTGYSVSALLGLVFLLCTVNSGCSYRRLDEIAYIDATQEEINHYQLYLTNEKSHYWNYHEQQSDFSWVSLSYAPFEIPSSVERKIDAVEDTFGTPVDDIESIKVKPTKTPWAMAWDRSSVVRKMDEILQENGIASKAVRIRMIAHAIVASGWKQNVWNYNAWGVKQGSWEKAWYVMPTIEEDTDGNDVYVEDAAWRAFNDWPEAIRDFQSRISADSERPAYREAYTHLVDERVWFKTSKAYWNALGAGNYYTASKFTGEKFAKLCGGVRAVLR